MAGDRLVHPARAGGSGVGGGADEHLDHAHQRRTVRVGARAVQREGPRGPDAGHHRDQRLEPLRHPVPEPAEPVRGAGARGGRRRLGDMRDNGVLPGGYAGTTRIPSPSRPGCSAGVDWNRVPEHHSHHRENARVQMEAIDHQTYQGLRPYLFAVAYRMTGSASDAEDLVQDAWIRYIDAGTPRVDSLRAWLTTVVSRLALDYLKSARVK